MSSTIYSVQIIFRIRIIDLKLKKRDALQKASLFFYYLISPFNCIQPPPFFISTNRRDLQHIKPHFQIQKITAQKDRLEKP